jgi:hypothetical protein
MKGWFVLIDGKNEHDGPMEDVSGRFVAADRYLKAQDFVRMNRTHFYQRTGSLPANWEAECRYY